MPEHHGYDVMAKSTLTVAFTQDKKRLNLTGLISIRETVEVTITDGATLIDDNLVLKIQDQSNRGKTPPIAICSTWVTSGSDAVGHMNTNTVQAINAFESVGNEGDRSFNILLYTTGVSALMANDCICIKNFPSAVSTDPIDLDQCEAIQDLDDRLTDVENELANDVLKYADFSAVTDLASNSRVSDNRNKINEILAILRDD